MCRDQREREKKLLDLSLKEARRRQSAITAWVHSENKEEIPLLDNAALVMTLLRSRSVDHFQEGIKRLEWLCAFQTPTGAFPKYVHLFGFLEDHQVSVHLLAIFFWIDRHFARFMSKPLRERLQNTRTALFAFCLKRDAHRPFSSGTGALLAALTGKFEKRAMKPRSSEEWGDWLLAAQIAYEGKGTQLEQAARLWNPMTGVYLGAPVAEFYEKRAPQVTLMHLFMADYAAHYPPYVSWPHPIHIFAGLIFSAPQPASPEKEQTSWGNISAVKNASSLNGEKFKRGAHLFRYTWQGTEGVHSFVCQEKQCGFKQVGDREFLLSYPEEEVVDKERIECSFFVDNHPEVALRVAGEQATLFRLSDLVQIKTPSGALTVRFDCVEGEGVFSGHISQGNRPAQLVDDGKAYDWKIDLRTIRRTARFKLRCVLAQAEVEVSGCPSQGPSHASHCRHKE